MRVLVANTRFLYAPIKTITEFAKPVSVDVQRRFIPAHYLMPLPISEINKNPNMVQNPGYDE